VFCGWLRHPQNTHFDCKFTFYGCAARSRQIHRGAAAAPAGAAALASSVVLTLVCLIASLGFFEQQEL